MAKKSGGATAQTRAAGAPKRRTRRTRTVGAVPGPGGGSKTTAKAGANALTLSDKERLKRLDERLDDLKRAADRLLASFG